MEITPEMLLWPFIKLKIIIVIIKAIGSLLPLSSSIMDAVPSFKLRFFDLKIENTDAASVELITAPINILSNKANFKM